MRGWGRTGAIALATIGALIGTASGAAAALHPGNYVLRTIDLSNHGGMSGTRVSCPSGKRVVTGGAFWHRAGQGPDASLDVFLDSSSATADGKGWYAAGTNLSGQDLQLRVMVQCLGATHVGTYQVKSAEVSVTKGSFGALRVACGVGKQAVTGGAYWHRSGHAADAVHVGVLTGSIATADMKAWYASGLNSANETLQLHVSALCLPTARVGTRHAKTVEVTINNTETGGVLVKCAAGMRVLTGGAYWHRAGQPTDSNLGAYLDSSNTTGDAKGWFAAGHNISGEQLVLHVSAFCIAP